MYPLFSSQLIAPPQVCPCAQQPTLPKPVSCMFMHVLPVPQQLFGAPIEEQLFVPSGHRKSLAKSGARGANRRSESIMFFSECGRSGEKACMVAFLMLKASSLRTSSSSSPAKIQFSSMNISPSSPLIFFVPTGFSPLLILSSTLIPLLTWTSSSGKYFMCFGRLCGHCGSEAAGGMERSRRAMRLSGSCISARWIVVQQICKSE